MFVGHALRGTFSIRERLLTSGAGLRYAGAVYEERSQLDVERMKEKLTNFRS